jgi:hypothetical protein
VAKATALGVATDSAESSAGGNSPGSQRLSWI